MQGNALRSVSPQDGIHLPLDMKLLLVEDNAALAHWLCEALRRAQLTVDHAADGQSADSLLLTQHYDVVLLDLHLPTLSGQSVLQRLRNRRNAVPVLILTASGGIDDKVACLGAGADDYLVKPFEIRELIARIQVLVRRSTPDQTVELQCGDLTYHTGSRVFMVAGQPLVLPAREHSVLEILMLKVGRTVSKQALVNGVFGLDDEASPEAIEIYIHRLRKKLEHSSATIVTLRGLGYLLRAS
ncbi:DNA-binding response regulator [Ralstonia solanacearum]|nr:DNA-binding response regulator [Ralstonia solanacearum]NJZ81585.1 DNA-binding response regulator [Ralstonia solanacearum]NKA73681.1 DNA-binding response regulator [Ralstonia solanacearum]NKA77085.1 DNA-binding response regulator [Ralstonia solanacearum]NKA93096.1 DNA-binding response regulator [Ralstonia solanacearum]